MCHCSNQEIENQAGQLDDKKLAKLDHFVIFFCSRKRMSRKTTVLEVDDAFKRLERVVCDVVERISVDGMLDLCQRTSPARTGIEKVTMLYLGWLCSVLSGGMLVEAFIVMNGTRETKRLLYQLEKKNMKLSNSESKQLLDEVKVDFYFYCLNTMATRGRAATRQLFFITLLLKARGLSRLGMLLESKMHICLPPRTFDLELKRHTIRVNGRIK